MRLDAALFDLDGRPVSLGLALAVALLSRRLVPRLEGLRGAMSKDAAVDAAGGHEESALTARVNAWRSATNLSSAELTQAWLDAHGLELSDLVAFASRRLSASSPRGDGPEIPYSEALEELPRELIFDGALEELANEVALAMVVEGKETPAARRALREELERAPWGAALIGALPEAELEEAVAVEARFRADDAVTCAPEAVARELERIGRRLVKIELTSADFEREGVALEVVATIRDDRQLWLEQLAEQLGVVPERSECYVEDLSGTATAAKLATGQVGDVIGPEETPTGFRVYEILGRVEPTLADEVVSDRVRAQLRRRAHAAAVERRVRARVFGQGAAPR